MRIALTWTRGKHQLSFGAWFQQFQSNETIALSQFGQATFASLQTFLAGTVGTFLYDPAPTQMNWRSLFGAWYVEDVFRLNPRLTLTLGFRSEFSTGWNEAHGRAANYTFTNGVISTDPHIGGSLFTTNNATFLPQPRIGVAWSPFGTKDRDSGGIRHVQRFAGCAGLSDGPERAVQSGVQPGESGGVEACRSIRRRRCPRERSSCRAECSRTCRRRR